MLIALVTLAWCIGVLLTATTVLRFLDRQHVQRRVFESARIEAPLVDAVNRAGIARWLLLAGYRSPGAAAGFVAATLAALAFGATFAYVVWVSGVLAAADRAIAVIPGGLSNLARPMLLGVPWMLLLMSSTVPLLVVRQARRRRVGQVTADLPITLELLATLAEAGLGFDAALDRILASQPPDRALVDEFRTFQSEILAGRPRVESLRRVARRLEVTPVTIFISSLVQAEQIGSGVAEVLRNQSDDLRQRRRERAIEFSMALPVKLLFPLVICFLPGILVFTLGPAFYEFFRLADTYGHARALTGR
jgi:tight adherence protein C